MKNIILLLEKIFVGRIKELERKIELKDKHIFKLTKLNIEKDYE